MFLSCRPRIWCVSDDSELFLGSFGLTKHYESIASSEWTMPFALNHARWQLLAGVRLRGGAQE